jgi:hypothetical protein
VSFLYIFCLCLCLLCVVCRAACYKQLSNFDGTISDCTSVLEVKVHPHLIEIFSQESCTLLVTMARGC